MTPSVTVKGQITIPKPMREHMGATTGSRLRFEPLPDGRVAISLAEPATKPKRTSRMPAMAQGDPLAKWLGAGAKHMGSAELMRQTRGEDWNQA